jgi:hypothetical protein
LQAQHISLKLIAKDRDGSAAAGAQASNTPYNAIKTNVDEYSLAASETVAPTTGWSTTPPTRTPGNFIWVRTVTTYNDNSTSTSPAVLLTGNTGSTGPTGSPAANVILTATSQVLSVAAGGAITPTTSTVTGTTANTTITTYDYSVDGAAFSTTLPAGVGRVGNVVTITGSTMTAKTITVRMADAAGVSDTMTVAKVSDGATGGTGSAGSNGYTVMLTNEAQVFAGTINTAQAGTAATSVIAYQGSTLQNATIGTITGLPTGMTAAITNNGTSTATVTFTVTTSLTQAQGTVTIPITVNGISFTQVFSWSVAYTGATGGQGIQGPPGTNGAPTYTWIKYATSATGTGLQDSPTGMTYIGISPNQLSATESTIATDYQWSLIQGPQGTPAADITLTTNTQVLAVPVGGGATSPATATVTGAALNTTITAWTYSVDGAAFSASVPAGVSRTGNVVTITGSTMTARTITVQMADAAGVADSLTVAKVADGATGGTGGTGPAGADAYTVLLTNEAQTIQGSTTSANAGSFTSTVIAYKGAVQQTATIGTITGQVTGLTTAITNNGTTAPLITVTVTTALTTGGTLTIPITVGGITFTKTLAWSLALQGIQGSTGGTGVGVSSVTTYYYQQAPGSAPSVPVVSPPPAPWSATEPGYVANTEVYTVERVVYTNATFAYGAVNKDSAYTAATQAMTTANGKNTIFHSTTVPGVTVNVAGDTWFQYNGSNNIINQWRGNGGTSWTLQLVDTNTIANLDAGKITANSVFTNNLNVASTFTVGTASTNGIIQSYNFDATNGFQLSKTGLIIRGAGNTVSAGALQAGSAIITNLSIGAGGTVQSTNWNGTSTGWQLAQNGLTIYNGAVKADTITAGTWGSSTGIINLAAGSILNLNGGNIRSNTYNGGAGANAGATAGFYIGNDGLVVAQGYIKAEAFYGGTMSASTITIGSGGAIQSSNYNGTSAGWSLSTSGLDIFTGNIRAAALNIGMGGGNLLRNSSLESGQNPGVDPAIAATGWGPYNNGPESMTVSFVAGRTGGFAYRATWSANTSTKGLTTLGSNLNLTRANSTYTLSFWARASEAVVFGLAWNTGPTTQTWAKNPVASSTIWQRYIVTLSWGATVDANNFFIRILGSNIAGWLELDDIQYEEGDVATAYAGSSTYIDGAQVVTGALISTSTVGSVDGSPLWSIPLNGSATFQNLLVRGQSVVGTSADGINSFIQSYIFAPGSAGWKIDSAGNAEFNQVVVRGTIYATDGSFTGTLSSPSINLGPNITMNTTSGITIVQPNGVINFPADGTEAKIQGQFTASTLTSSASTLNGATSIGGTAKISRGIGDPTTGPTLSAAYPRTAFTGFGIPTYNGFCDDSTGAYWMTISPSNANNVAVTWYDKGTGAYQTWINVPLTVAISSVNGIVRFGSTYWIITTNNGNGTIYFSPFTSSGPGNMAGAAGGWTRARTAGAITPATVNGNPGSSQFYISEMVNPGSGNFTFVTSFLTSTGGLINGWTHTSPYTSGTYDLRSAIPMPDVPSTMGYYFPSAPLAYWIGTPPQTRTSAREFPYPPGYSCAAMYRDDAGRMWMLDTAGGVTKFAAGRGDASTIYGTYTWYDGNATGGTHETAASPATTFSWPARAWLSVSGAPAPESALATQDAANLVRLYLGTTSTTTKLQSVQPTQGVTTITYDTVNTSSGAAPPATNSFATVGTTGSIESSALTGAVPIWQLKGDGVASFNGSVSFNSTTAASSAAGNAPALKIGAATGTHLRVGPSGIFAMTSDTVQGSFQTNNPLSQMLNTATQNLVAGWTQLIFNTGTVRGNIGQTGNPGFHTIAVAGWYHCSGFAKVVGQLANGGRYLLKIEKYTSEGVSAGFNVSQYEGYVLGTTFAIVPYSLAAEGYIYLNANDKIRLILYCSAAGQLTSLDNTSYGARLDVVMIP